MSAEVIQVRPLGLQLCMPADWTPQQIVEFASSQHICGTTNGWQYSESHGRTPCANGGDKVHVVVQA